MSMETLNKIKKTSPKRGGHASVEELGHIEDTKTGHVINLNPVNQNYFPNEMSSPGGETEGLQTYKTVGSQQLEGVPLSPIFDSKAGSQNLKEEQPILKEEYEEPLSFSPESKSPVAKTGLRPLGLAIKRQDSIPVIVKDFNEITNNLNTTDEKVGSNDELQSPVITNDRNHGGLSNSTIVASKFAREHGAAARANPNNNGIVTVNHSTKNSRSGFINETPKGGLHRSIEHQGSNAKKNWNKLSYIFQSVMFFNREEVKNIKDPAAILGEIDAFQLRTWRQEPRKVWDISRQDYAREGFANLRKINLFCECASIGSKSHAELMREMIISDPKKYLVEPDDPTFIINHPNNRGQTPLYIAAKNGNLNVIKLLLEFKASPMILSKISPNDNSQELAIHAAVKWDHNHVVEYLLQNCDYSKDLVTKCLPLTDNKKVLHTLCEHLGLPGYKRKSSLFKCFG